MTATLDCRQTGKRIWLQARRARRKDEVSRSHSPRRTPGESGETGPRRKIESRTSWRWEIGKVACKVIHQSRHPPHNDAAGRGDTNDIDLTFDETAVACPRGSVRQEYTVRHVNRMQCDTHVQVSGMRWRPNHFNRLTEASRDALPAGPQALVDDGVTFPDRRSAC